MRKCSYRRLCNCWMFKRDVRWILRLEGYTSNEIVLCNVVSCEYSLKGIVKLGPGGRRRRRDTRANFFSPFFLLYFLTNPPQLMYVCSILPRVPTDRTDLHTHEPPRHLIHVNSLIASTKTCICTWLTLFVKQNYF